MTLFDLAKGVIMILFETATSLVLNEILWKTIILVVAGLFLSAAICKDNERCSNIFFFVLQALCYIAALAIMREAYFEHMAGRIGGW